MDLKQYDNECHRIKYCIQHGKDEEEKQKKINQLNAFKMIHQILRIINKFEIDSESLNIYSDELKLIKEKLG